MKFKVCIATFPFGRVIDPDVANYRESLILKLSKDDRVHGCERRDIDDTPITASRNRAMAWAAEKKADFLLMLDNDMAPDIDHAAGVAGALPFFPTALEFMLKHPGPCVVAAPYCGPPPFEKVYVFDFGNLQTDNPNFDMQLNHVSREDAARRGGIQKVAAVPTGVMLIDMRCVQTLRHPYFDYEWKDDGGRCPTCGECKPGPRAERASTEDVYFSRNLSLAGVPQYVVWDSWAGHWKRKRVGKPSLLTLDQVQEQYREGIKRGQLSFERLVEVNPAGVGRR